MTLIDPILSRLKGVKGRSGAFSARCPAHEDNSPSLAITEKEDGRILLHCFGGCSVSDVLGAIGMDFNDLFPDDPLNGEHIKRSNKPRFYATDLLRIIKFESTLIALCAYDMSKGVSLSLADQERLVKAHQRILEAVEYADV
jgi:hypothetical protein